MSQLKDDIAALRERLETNAKHPNSKIQIDHHAIARVLAACEKMEARLQQLAEDSGSCSTARDIYGCENMCDYLATQTLKDVRGE